MHSLEDGINAVRHTLPHCWFAEDECSTGIRHLKAYRKDWDAERGVLERQTSTRQLVAIAPTAFAISRWRGVKYRLIPSQQPTPKEIIREMMQAAHDGGHVEGVRRRTT